MCGWGPPRPATRPRRIAFGLVRITPESDGKKKNHTKWCGFSFWQRMRDSNLVNKTFYVLNSAYFIHCFHFLALFILKSPFNFHYLHSRKGKIRENSHRKPHTRQRRLSGVFVVLGFKMIKSSLSSYSAERRLPYR